MTAIYYDKHTVLEIGAVAPKADALAPLTQQANIYALIIVHKERKAFIRQGDDNYNHFTVIAHDEEHVLKLFYEWYWRHSEGGIPAYSYDITTRLLVENITTPVLGVIQYAYRW